MVHRYKQLEDVDYNKTWAEIVKPSLFWLFFTIPAKQELYIEQIDVITIFFYSFLDKNIFVNQPEKYMINTTLICHFQKALYGLK